MMNTAGKTDKNQELAYLKVVIATWGRRCVLHFKVLEAELHCLPRR
jgi:hypothetical protein